MTLLKAKAKINLFFQIIGRREDGYHLIESLVVFAKDLYDLIEILPASNNKTEVVAGKFADLLQNEPNNLIDKVLDIFSDDNYHCKLTKDIPIGAGLGGGSSDAAIVAKFLNKQHLDINFELTKIGADLPVCYHANSSFCEGIGEAVKPVKNLPLLHLVLVNPNKLLLTKEVFKNNTQVNALPIENKPLDFENDIDKLINFLESLNNDLTKSAMILMPEITEILELLQSQEGCLLSRMSGSGPTCFGIFASKDLAMKAQDKITILKNDYFVFYTSC